MSDLNRTARRLLEESLPLTWVRGEISNFKAYDSGHWYFSLKDPAAQVRCVMFRQRNQYLDWVPREGTQVEVRALVTLYEPRGEFQLNVELLRRAGLGALYEAFERLKAKLEREGLFDPARKRPIPAFPAVLGIVTSPQAAALRDVLATLRRRMPSIPVILYPTPVQGEGAAQSIADALRVAGERAEVDVLILCRGGGSIEDLWSFNDESVARAIAACPIPVVSGIGHETDFTIADFVVDRRAPTPTAAAELVSPSREQLLQTLAALTGHLRRAGQRALELSMQRLDYLSRRLVHPRERLAHRSQHLAHLASRLRGAASHGLAERGWRLKAAARQLSALRPKLERAEERAGMLARRLAAALARRMEAWAGAVEGLRLHLLHLNPEAVLERGYSIVRRTDGTLVRDSEGIRVGDRLGVTFARGAASVEVREKR